jgi:hypothetical protein
VTIDPKNFVSVIDQSGPEVWLSELNALCAAQSGMIGGQPSSADVTAALSTALRKGWVQSDGLRVSVSGSGRRALSA